MRLGYLSHARTWPECEDKGRLSASVVWDRIEPTYVGPRAATPRNALSNYNARDRSWPKGSWGGKRNGKTGRETKRAATRFTGLLLLAFPLDRGRAAACSQTLPSDKAISCWWPSKVRSRYLRYRCGYRSRQCRQSCRRLPWRSSRRSTGPVCGDRCSGWRRRWSRAGSRRS